MVTNLANSDRLRSPDVAGQVEKTFMRFGHSISLLVLALGIACQAHARGSIATEDLELGIPDCSGPNLNTLRCARGIERRELSRSGATVKRSNGTLSIRLASKTISIVDKSSEGSDDIEEYCYLGFNKQINSHLLHVQHYEGNAYLVIHHESGQRAFTSGYPVAAPDGNHFMSLSEDLFAGYVPNGIEIWQVSAGTYVRVANFETKWGPHDGNWLDARRARVAKQCFSPTENDPAALKMCGVARIQRTGQTWKLVE